MTTDIDVPARIEMSSHLTVLRCLHLLARHHGIQVPPDKLAMVDTADSVGSVLLLMRDVGLAGKLVKKVRWKGLASLGTAFPAMAEQEGGHWVIVVNVALATEDGDFIAILDPENELAGVKFIPRHEFESTWTKRLVLCKRDVRSTDEPQKFGFMWFMPEILKNGRFFRDVAIFSMLTNIISMGTPLLFNILIDKVVPHRSYNTLLAVVFAFVLVSVFDGIFSYVRSYLMMYASNKIDARLAQRTFDHMLRLPMDFFEKQTVGVLLRNVQQTESVRNFLTGRLFFTLLEVVSRPSSSSAWCCTAES